MRNTGTVEVGGVDVRQIDPHVLMDQVAFVFQNNRLFKASILENVRAARPDASREQVLAALEAAQCGDILEKLPQGLDTVIGTEGTYLSRRRGPAHRPGPGHFKGRTYRGCWMKPRPLPTRKMRR